MEKLIIELDDDTKETFKDAVKWNRTTQKEVISKFIHGYNKSYKEKSTLKN